MNEYGQVMVNDVDMVEDSKNVEGKETKKTK